jgi:tagaturonate epimerase
MGDRFGRQAKAQLQAVMEARRAGMAVTPVWNKSNREHNLIGTEPPSVRAGGAAAVQSLGWTGAWHVDADHIGLGTVDRFLDSSDFFTVDVADYSGKASDPAAVEHFVDSLRPRFGTLHVPGLNAPMTLDAGTARAAAQKFLLAMQEAGRIYRHIAGRKGDDFITEVSVDETDRPQSPVELLLILAMIAAEGIPAQTVAPKFTGRFNKGVDYVGDVEQFAREFEADLCVVRYATEEFGLPRSLKLSIHSGSDKFSLYPVIRGLIQKHDAGLHVKTAGTTWLEELIGLAESGGDALALVREIYIKALPRFEELVQPYEPVVDIDRARLPSANDVAAWGARQITAALRHDPGCPDYNLHFRQFLHVSFKIAGEMNGTYTAALEACEAAIAPNVTGNLYDRHLKPIFA